MLEKRNSIRLKMPFLVRSTPLHASKKCPANSKATVKSCNGQNQGPPLVSVRHICVGYLSNII